MTSASAASGRPAATATATGPSIPTDLIESKFNELAKKILEELRQAGQRAEFLQALDQCLSEAPAKRQDVAARKLLLQARRSRQQARRQAEQQQQQQANTTTIITSTVDTSKDNEALRRQCDLILEKQRQQQEQLDSHQQILFDSQYRSLPSEITQAVAGHEQRRANQRLLKSATAPDANGPTRPASDTQQSQGRALVGARPQKSSAGSPSKRPGGVATSASSSSVLGAMSAKQRSAIPTSTVLSGIQQTTAAATSTGFALSKSATTTAAAVATGGGEPASQPVAARGLQPGLVRQTSLRINKQTREAQQEFIKRHTAGASLTASEKLKQRRPTKATIATDQQQQQQVPKVSLASDDSDDLDDDEDDDDDDEDDDENILLQQAATRAFLNQRFMNQQTQQQQPQQISKSKTVSDARRANEASERAKQQQQQQREPTSQVSQVARQKQRFSAGGAPIVRSSTIGPSSGTAIQRPVVITTSRPTSRNEERQEPRSLGGLLTSHDIGQLYKPHMNYSTSLLGNHRLSDDDEIIIIPTTQSPSLLSASVSPDPHHHANAHPGQYHQAAGEQPDQSTNNMDEFSERFSISRTKSFWEKLASSKGPRGAAGGDPQQQHEKQFFNSSIRSINSSGGGAAGPNLVAVDAKGSQNSLLNSHDASAGSGAAAAATGAAQQPGGQFHPAAMKSAFDRMDSTGGSGNSHYSGCSSSTSTSGDEQQTNGFGRANKTGQAATAASRPKANQPTINQLIRQDELNRSDRFRQTR